MQRQPSQKQRNPMLPNAVIPTPIHHRLSAFDSSCFLMTACPKSSKFLFTLAVAVAPAEVLVGFAVGLRVCVGSICGGLKARYIGFMGDPSNLKRSRRGTLW